MSAVADAAIALETALGTVTGDQTYRDPGANIVPPATILGPPALNWEGGCVGPTSARFLVYAVVPSAEDSVERLWDLVVDVAAAIDEQTSAVVVLANPAVYMSGTTPLPCYEIQVEAPL